MGEASRETATVLRSALLRFAEDKGIKLKSRENYSVAKTKLSKEEKEAKLKKYGVKEGEIFFDEKLIGKRYRR